MRDYVRRELMNHSGRGAGGDHGTAGRVVRVGEIGNDRMTECAMPNAEANRPRWPLPCIGHSSLPIRIRPDGGGASMIPRRVRLSGFLCYKDEQEVAFDGSSLWMLVRAQRLGQVDHLRRRHLCPVRPPPRRGVERRRTDQQGLQGPRASSSSSSSTGSRFRSAAPCAATPRGSPKGTQQVFRLDACERQVGCRRGHESDGRVQGLGPRQDRPGLRDIHVQRAAASGAGREAARLDTRRAGRRCSPGSSTSNATSDCTRRRTQNAKSVKAKLEAVAGSAHRRPGGERLRAVGRGEQDLRRRASQGVGGERSRAAARPGVRGPAVGRPARRGSPG